MAIGRIPGPLGDSVGTKVVRSSAALGGRIDPFLRRSNVRVLKSA